MSEASPSTVAPVSAEDERLAVHEVAHTVAGYMLEGDLGPVSIVRRARWNGVAFSFAPEAEADEIAAVDFSWPLTLWPPGVRRLLERRIMIRLAGREAERHHGILPLGYLPPDPDEEAAERMVLSVDDRRTLARGDEPESADEAEATRDEARALADAWILAREGAGIVLEHLRLETRRLVEMPRFQRLLAALVPELLARRELGREVVLEILENADKPKEERSMPIKTKTRKKPDPKQSYVCVMSYATDREVHVLEEELRGDHPAVAAHPEHWRPLGTPRSEWPTPFDRAITEAEEQDAAEAARNTVMLSVESPPRMRSTAEIIVDRAGVPTTIMRGSEVLADDELVSRFPDCWEFA